MKTAKRAALGRAIWAGFLSATVAISAWSMSGCQLGDDDTRWVTVRSDTLVVGVDVTGQLASTVSHLVGPPPVLSTWNFKISSMVTEGDAIEQGKPVIRFDASTLQRKLEEYRNEADSATKELDAHQARARMARRDSDLQIKEAEAAQRKAALMASGSSDVVAANAIAAARLDLEFATYATEVARRKARAQAGQDRAETERLQRVKARAAQQVERLQEEIAQMNVPAPIDGTVLYVVDWQDNKKKIGDTVWKGERILKVVSLDDMKAEGEVDEMDASRIARGQTVRLRLDANPDVELLGEVAVIIDAVQRRSPEDPLKVIKLEITLQDDAGKDNDTVELRPGMRFRGTIETERIPDVLVVPLIAVQTDADGALVYKKDGRDAVPTRITLGRRSRDQVEVLSGLVAGDRIAMVDESSEDEEAP